MLVINNYEKAYLWEGSTSAGGTVFSGLCWHSCWCLHAEDSSIKEHLGHRLKCVKVYTCKHDFISINKAQICHFFLLAPMVQNRIILMFPLSFITVWLLRLLIQEWSCWEIKNAMHTIQSWSNWKFTIRRILKKIRIKYHKTKWLSPINKKNERN